VDLASEQTRRNTVPALCEVYRGYSIALEERQDGIRVHVNPMYFTLPILSHGYFDWKGDRQNVLAEARRRVDELLVNVDRGI
jgi:hypothetical protein